MDAVVDNAPDSGGRRTERFMDVRQMRYLVEIIEGASFSQASRSLNIAQPALSQQISRLEHDVGTPLLIRSSRGVSPTSAGRILYRQAKTILRQIEQAMTSARETKDVITGLVTLGLPPTTMANIGVALTERLRESQPGIQLNLVEGLSGDLQRQARAGDLDITVLFTQEGVPGWSCEALLREELFLVLPMDERYFPFETTSVSLREIAGLPLILPSSKHSLRRRIDMEFERLEITIAPIAEIDSLTVLMQCLARGMGATIKPSAAIKVHGLDLASRWRCLRVNDVSLTRVNYLYSSSATDHLPAARVVVDEINQLSHDLTADGSWPGCTFIGQVLPRPKH